MQERNVPKVLIVDDRPENLLVMESILDSSDYQVIKAGSGNEALALLLEHDFALVLLDVQMPEMDGFETAELMRGSARTRYIPIIFVTAISKEKQCIFKGYESGAVDYLFKPIEPIILQSKVNVFLELYNQKQALKEQAELLEKRLKELMELRQVNGELVSLSTLDGLTGIPNRRSFDRHIDMHWKEAVREESAISLIIMDIDYFKGYNDHYGHLKGDDCLIQIAKTLASGARRPTDLVARYGGEEFAAILPHTDTEGAVFIAETMRKNIENLCIPHQNSQIADFVTISLGISSLIPKQADSMEALIASADKALYQAKMEGRNRVHVLA